MSTVFRKKENQTGKKIILTKCYKIGKNFGFSTVCPEKQISESVP